MDGGIKRVKIYIVNTVGVISDFDNTVELNISY